MAQLRAVLLPAPAAGEAADGQSGGGSGSGESSTDNSDAATALMVAVAGAAARHGGCEALERVWTEALLRRRQEAAECGALLLRLCAEVGRGALEAAVEGMLRRAVETMG